jgi:methyl-accepting chemotaxis protein
MTLKSIQGVGMRLVALLVIALAVITGIAAAMTDLPGKWIGAGLAGLLAILPGVMAMQGRVDAQARIIAAITVVAMPAILLFVCEGAAWQVDLHMMFFALLAATSILCDARAILAATAVVAVHHIGLGFLVPEWIFGTDSSFGRIVLHAVILVVEAGVLIWLARSIVALVAANAAQTEANAALDATLAADRARQDAELQLVTGAVGTGLTALAAGDLTAKITNAFPPGYEVLKRDFNAAVTSLGTIMSAVGESSQTVLAGITEIAQASEDLARRTESNAASLEQTSAALVQIETRLKASARSSVSTVARADQAIATVGAGRTTAMEAVAAMTRVGSSAKGIDSVIEGVDKIAFQTRVLAMNAAVEAGRAGEAGRGFAVVADLVSALAMRAEEEAKRARDQLGVTQSDIDTAVKAVERVDAALNTISVDVGAVHELLGTIAADNQAQSSAVSEITSAVASMDRATQQNAAMVEETSAASLGLAEEVNALADRTAQFRSDNADAKTVRNRATTPHLHVAA